jgi:hypothetical protein
MIVNGARRNTAASPRERSLRAIAGWQGASGRLLVSKTATFKSMISTFVGNVSLDNDVRAY